MSGRRDFIKQTGLLMGSLLIPLPLLGKSESNKMKTSNQYDVVIVGGSYSGLAAGMALGRALRNVLIIDSGNPCNKQTPHSHNFLTNDGKTPKEIAALAKAQVLAYPSVSLVDGIVTESTKTAKGFSIKTQAGDVYHAKKLVFATGISDLQPNIPGLAACWGISVLHCPYCHGYEARSQKTGILANGDMAFEFASLISNWSNDLTLYTNGASTLTPAQTEKIRSHGIGIVEHKVKSLTHNNGHITHIVFEDGTWAALVALYTRLPFKQHCMLPVNMGCELTTDGYILIDPAHKTTVPGIFACGDNTTRMRTVANAVGMGTTTGLMVNKELIEESF